MSRLKRQRAHVLICTHKTCLKQGAKAVAKELKRAVRDEGLRSTVMLTDVDCLDHCGRGPIVVVYPDGVWYKDVDEQCAKAIIKHHLIEGRPVEGHILHEMKNR